MHRSSSAMKTNPWHIHNYYNAVHYHPALSNILLSDCIPELSKCWLPTPGDPHSTNYRCHRIDRAHLPNCISRGFSSVGVFNSLFVQGAIVEELWQGYQ